MVSFSAMKIGSFRRKEQKAARKISIDDSLANTSQDKHQQQQSQDFSRSFDDGAVQIFPQQGAQPPTVLSNQSPDGSPSAAAPTQQFFCYSTNFAPAPLQLPSPLPNPHHQELRTSHYSDPALQARREAIKIQQKMLGENHPDVIFALTSLARLHQKRGNHAEAASILREAQMCSSKANSARERQKHQVEPNIPIEISFSG